VVILDRNVDLAGHGLRIINGGKLIFKDFARTSQNDGLGINEPLTLRAKSVEVTDHGELWIGSRSCRYLGKADIVLYGNEGDMPESDARPGSKYLWANTNGVLEMHGKEKLSWTQLDEVGLENDLQHLTVTVQAGSRLPKSSKMLITAEMSMKFKAESFGSIKMFQLFFSVEISAEINRKMAGNDIFRTTNRIFGH